MNMDPLNYRAGYAADIVDIMMTACAAAYGAAVFIQAKISRGSNRLQLKHCISPEHWCKRTIIKCHPFL